MIGFSSIQCTHKHKHTHTQKTLPGLYPDLVSRWALDDC